MANHIIKRLCICVILSLFLAHSNAKLNFFEFFNEMSQFDNNKPPVADLFKPKEYLDGGFYALVYKGNK